MHFLDVLIDTNERENRARKIYGAVIGIVTNNQDPEKSGRVKVRFPWLSAEDESCWARIASPMAGKERGIYFLPEVDDEVLVMFEHGDPRFPYVIGALWNGKDLPPENNDDGKNNLRVIKSRSGHLVRLNDEEGKEKIEIIDKTGKNSLIFDTANNTIELTSDKDIHLKAEGGTIRLEAQKIEMKTSSTTKFTASSALEIESNSSIDIKASGTMNLKGATINLN